MRARRRDRVEHRQAAAAAGAAGERHRRVEDLSGDVAVIAAEGLARRGAALHHLYARFEVDEVQGVRRRLRHRGVGRDLVLQHVLDGGVSDGRMELRRRDHDRADPLAVRDLPSGHGVLVHLIDQRARENELEELIDLRDERAVRRLLPSRAPEDREHFDVGDERAVAVREARQRRRRRREGFGRLQNGVSDVERHDPDRIAVRGNEHLRNDVGLGHHAGLLARSARPKERVHALRLRVIQGKTHEGSRLPGAANRLADHDKPNRGRSRVPSMLPANADGSHTQPCTLPDAMPLKYAPMLQPYAMRAP